PRRSSPMLVLLESSAGFAIFKVLDEKRLVESQNVLGDFADASAAASAVQLCQFVKFDDITEALAATTSLLEGRISKKLRKALRKLQTTEVLDGVLGVADSRLGSAIKEKLGIGCVCSSAVMELVRAIRSQIDALLPQVAPREMAAMQLGLAHSLSRYKLKFSPDKIDTMIVQAISLLDDLDKETNNYVMRVKEMYGWHFPELAKIVQDGQAYVKAVKTMGLRENAISTDLTECLPEEIIEDVRNAALVSLGTEMTDADLVAVHSMCDQVSEMSEYRTQLYDYIRSRMNAVAPNLTVLVGELVGARLISHAGTLLSLAKHPSSTVQILGAEKALFRALKTKHQTPKYGLLYHASLVGQANAKIKGKISRMLAAKTSLAIRVDALGEGDSVGPDMGLASRAYLERRLKSLESGGGRGGLGRARAQSDRFVPDFGPSGAGYTGKRDADASAANAEQRGEKRPAAAVGGDGDSEAASASSPPKKKKKQQRDEQAAEVKQEPGEEQPASAKKAKKKHREEAAAVEPQEEEAAAPQSDKKKKKKARQSVA
ncbi:hypothetical protein BOX15_Mlig012732g1, partial [Macrostomum lignano]